MWGASIVKKEIIVKNTVSGFLFVIKKNNSPHNLQVNKTTLTFLHKYFPPSSGSKSSTNFFLAKYFAFLFFFITGKKINKLPHFLYMTFRTTIINCFYNREKITNFYSFDLIFKFSQIYTQFINLYTYIINIYIIFIY